MEQTIKALLDDLEDPDNETAFVSSDELARLGTSEIVEALIERLNHDEEEVRFLSARTLGQIHENQAALEPMLEAIQSENNKAIAGDLLMFLEDFDLSTKFVEIFKLYLFGSFKVSSIAKNFLDYKEFEITSRVIKKSYKHLNHYSNNVKKDDAYQLKKAEADEILADLTQFLDESK